MQKWIIELKNWKYFILISIIRKLVNSHCSLTIAELWQPKGPPSGAPYSYRKDKETHEWIFS